MDNIKKTAGEIANEGRTKPSAIISPYDSAEEALKNYFKDIEECVNIHKKMAIYNSNDFYVVVLIIRDRVLGAITPTRKSKMMATLACPVPFFDQNVYKYHKDLHVIEELWMMADPETCGYLEKNKHMLNKYEKKLLEYYHKYKSNELWRLMKKENNEEEDSPKLKRTKG